MKWKIVTASAVALSILTGCAPFTMKPLAPAHPAHLDAPAALNRPASKTLAYTAADMPAMRPAVAVMATQGGDHDGDHSASPQARETVVGEGKVIATVPSASQVVLEHGEIKGFMEGMTMGYRVAPPSMLEGLQIGDKVRFTIDVRVKTIIAIEKIR